MRLRVNAVGGRAVSRGCLSECLLWGVLMECVVLVCDLRCQGILLVDMSVLR
jgi:hypothetical protein